MIPPFLNFVRIRHGPSPSALVDLHAKYYRNVLLFCFGLSLSRSLFGDNIVCRNYDVSSVSPHYVQTRCFLNGTMTRLPEGEKYFNHDYYQWIPAVLLLAALYVQLPLQVWTRTAGKVASRLRGAKDESTASEISYAIAVNASRWRLFLRTCLFEWYLLVHFLAGAFGLDHFLFRGLWIRHAGHDVLFPEEGTCWFDYISGGSDNTSRLLCLLPLNVVYKRVFYALYLSLIPMGLACLLASARRVMQVCVVGPSRIETWWCTRIALDSCETWTARKKLEWHLQKDKEEEEA